MSDRPKLPENPPFAKGPYWVNGAMWICGVDAYGGTCHIADMRGWGYLTGHGMALALSNDDAFNAQKDTANWIVAAMNAYAQPAPVTVEEAARVLLDDSGRIGVMMRKIVALAGVATEDFPDRCALPIVTNASPTMGEARALRALAGEKPNE
jgi:hypothetical protein